MAKSSWLFLLLSLWALPVHSQEVTETTFNEVGESYARAYVTPLADGLGADLNAGLFHTASTGHTFFGINVYFGLKFSASLLSGPQTFDLVYQDRVAIEYDLNGELMNLDLPATFTVTDAPTIFGPEEEAEATIRVQHDTTFQTLGLTLPVSIDSTLAPETLIGGLVETDVAPFVVPQIGIGTVLGTDLMVRWLPSVDLSDNGSIELFGLGIRHSLNQYLPVIPFDLAIQAVWQRVQAQYMDADIEDLSLDARVFAVNVAASKRFGVLTVYAGLQSERSDVGFAYIQTPDEDDPDEVPLDIDFTLSDIGKTRAIIGAGVQLGAFLFNTDISVGEITVASAGIGVAF